MYWVNLIKTKDFLKKTKNVRFLTVSKGALRDVILNINDFNTNCLIKQQFIFT